MTDADFDDTHFIIELPPGSSWTVGDGPNGTFILQAVLPDEPHLHRFNKKLKLETPMKLFYEE